MSSSALTYLFHGYPEALGQPPSIPTNPTVYQHYARVQVFWMCNQSETCQRYLQAAISLDIAASQINLGRPSSLLALLIQQGSCEQVIHNSTPQFPDMEVGDNERTCATGWLWRLYEDIGAEPDSTGCSHSNQLTFTEGFVRSLSTVYSNTAV
uniref:Spermatogenesis associated 12 n=1 Tax=Cebus imitator TaxID=2715852 RepID=A0A2K5QLL6_CEBIM